MRISAVGAADRFLPEKLSQQLSPWLLRLDQMLDGSTEHAVAQRVSLIAFSVRIVSAAIALVSQVIFARWMGQFEYGIFVLVWVTVVILGNLSCLGFQTSVIRFVPEYLERQQLDHLRGILFTSKAFALGLTTLHRAHRRGRRLLLPRSDRILLRRALHHRLHLPADDCAWRHARWNRAVAVLGVRRPHADLHHPAGSHPCS